MSLVESDSGVIVIDPLMSNESAAAALALYREHRGDRPVTALIITHSHADHFGGSAAVDRRRHPDLRPVRLPGARRVGERLRRGGDVAPRRLHLRRRPAARSRRADRRRPGDGHLERHHLADGPDRRHHPHRPGGDDRRGPDRLPAHSGHRGAGRDELLLPRPTCACAWRRTPPTRCTRSSRCAAPRSATPAPGRATSARRCGSSAPTPTSSSPPTTGRPGGPNGSSTFLTQQRDLYAYLHDQTLRRMNQGHIGTEIAEEFALPPALDGAWHARGYYGSFSHNVKAIYQRYLGWYDGNPAHLWALPARGGGHPLRRSSWAAPSAVLEQGARDPGRGRPAVDRHGDQPRRLRRPGQRRGPGAPRRGPGEARARRRERAVAQHLPARSRGASWPDRRPRPPSWPRPRCSAP